MSDPIQRLRQILLTVLLVLLLPFSFSAPAADDGPPATSIRPGPDGPTGGEASRGGPPPASAETEGPLANGGPAATPAHTEAATPVPGEEETVPPGSEESQEPLPGDAVPAETLVTPEDASVLDQAEAETEPAEGTPEEEAFGVPIELNDKVRAYLDLFTGERRDRIQEAFDRAGRYLPMMRAIFQEQGLPRDLVNLAYIESAFKVRAYSRARAAGIWQFIAGTGRKYGLRVDWWLDERRDPEKATRAAAEYLSDLYGMFGSWPLAIAAYNAGEGKVAGAIRRQKTTDFWRLRLPRETKIYVPAFMAMTILAKDPARYGFVPPAEEVTPTEPLMLGEPLDLRIVAQAAGVALEDLRTLNPELNHLVTPPHRSDYRLRVPAGSAAEFAENFDEIKKTRRVTWQRHLIRRGETLSQIARRYDTSVPVLMDLNRLPSRHRLRAGRSLVVPLMHLALAEENGSTRPLPSAESSPRTYVVRRGDSLWRIAQVYDVSTGELQKWNDLEGTVIHPGLRLRIHPE
ncbi:MAG TPA: transglycosylase SLT domain-containing protein [Candidatus Methylomirabilis sp.]|nr:transglycosylase SLT domain-containing protein [Candidatus Methylomirabilis sp.]